MEIEQIKKLIKKHMAGHALVISNAADARRYYAVQNDIMLAPSKPKTLDDAF